MSNIVECFSGTLLEGARAFGVSSKHTGAEYVVRVATPPGYAEVDSAFPLLVVLDGAWVFGTAVESAGVQAMTGETRPVIIAGVSTRGDLSTHDVRRFRDYTPGLGMLRRGAREDNPVVDLLKERFVAAGLSPEEAMGGAPQFLAFLTDELLPMLCDHYLVDAHDLGVFGYSAAGAFASYVLLDKTAPFRKVMIGTFGTVWYGDELATLEAEFTAKPAPHGVDVFYGYGGAEVADFGGGTIGESVDLLRRLRRADPGYIHKLVIQRFARLQHGSVLAPVVSAGLHALWGTGLGYQEAARDR
jgi:predicted alpha/beta superfamily hydrolase